MSNLSEFRHPDMAGLNLDVDPNGMHALIAENVDLHMLGEVDKRPGLRRLNHHRYSGTVVCIPDVQRICDYNKMLVITSGGGGDDPEVYEHPEPGDPTIDPFFDQNWAPIAVASAAPTGGVVPLTVHFSSAGSFDPDGGPLTYYWDFGDGSHSHQPNPVHLYGVAGPFTATLTVTDEDGAAASASLVLSPTEPAVICVAGSTSVRYTDDDGATWNTAVGTTASAGQLLRLPGGALIHLGVDGVNHPVYRSADGGKNWALKVANVAGLVAQGCICPSGRIACPYDSVGGARMAYSDDEGATWTPRMVLVDGTNASYVVWIVAMSDRLVALVWNPPGAPKLKFYQSLDWGVTWALLRDATPAEGANTGPNYGHPARIDGSSFAYLGAPVGWPPLCNPFLTTDKGATPTAPGGIGGLASSFYGIGAYGTEVIIVQNNDPVFGQARIWRSANSGANYGAIQQFVYDGVVSPAAHGPAGWAVGIGDRVYFAATGAGPWASIGVHGGGPAVYDIIQTPEA